MERAAVRWIDGSCQSRHGLSLATLITLITLVMIVAICTSGCSSSQSELGSENQLAQRADPSTSTATRPSRVAAPTDLEPLRLAVYHFQPPPPPIASETETQIHERPTRPSFSAEPSSPDRTPLLAAPELEDPQFNDNDAEGYIPTIDAPLLRDLSFASRHNADAPEQPPVDEPERTEFAPQQSLPSAHIVRGGPGMRIVSRRANVYVRKGFELAGRGALYSARLQFILALRSIADALDVHSQTDHHAAALHAGLTALRESDDFRSPEAVTSRRPLAVIVSSHRTPILKHLIANPSVRVPGRVAAMQRYYTYAQQQLTVAGGRETTASRALYGLGKTSLAMQHSQDPAIIAGGPQALVLHQAALLIDSRNYMAANEVGVILAHCGQYYAARRTLRHAAANSNEAAVWKNLSMVHEYLGETGLALQARRQVEIVQLEKTRRPGSGTFGDFSGRPQQPIIWLDASEFAATSTFEADANPVSGKPHVDRQPSPEPKTPQAAQRRTPSKWFPSFGGTRR